MRFCFEAGNRRLVRFLSMACVLAGLAATAKAQPARPNPALAKQSVTASETSKKQSGDIATKYAQATGEIKGAADALAAGLTSLSNAQVKISKAYETGIASEVAEASAELAKEVATVAHARELLSALESQANYASEAQVATWKKMTGDVAAPQLEALLAARKSAAGAYSQLAAALASKAQPDVLDAARDATFAATADLMLANRTWMSARDIAARTAAATKAKNEDLLAKIADLQKADAELLGLLRQQNELALKVRKLERQRLKSAAVATELAKPKKK